MSFGANISDGMAAADGAPTLGASLEQVSEVAAVVAMHEPTLRYQRTARARRHLASMPEATGTNISFNISDYNHFLGGVDQHNATLALWPSFRADDVLR